MNHDLVLIAAILETPGGLSLARKLGIKPKMLNDEALMYWEYMVEHVETLKEVPSKDKFRAAFPQYDHYLPEDSVESMVHEVKSRYLHSEVEQGLRAIASINSASPWEAKAALLKLSEVLALDVPQNTADLVAGEDKVEVFKVIAQLQGNSGLLGYEWPWRFLNENTVGVVKGNFIYFYGREKSRKTFLLLYLALFWESLGLKVLFVTREMTFQEIAWRLYPMRAKLPYPEMVKGNISSDGMVTLEQTMDDLFKHKNLIVSNVEDGISGLRSKIEEVQPDIVIHDFLKAVADDEMGDKMNLNEHKYVARVADRCKSMAMTLNVVFIGCGHANREGEKLKGKSTTEIGHSDHIARRADIVARVIVDDALDRMGIIVNAGRGIQKYLSWTIDAKLDQRFGNFQSPETTWIDTMGDAESEKKTQAPEDKDRIGKTLGNFGGAPKFTRK